MAGNPQEYRKRALICAERAASRTSPAKRQKFEDLAKIWLMLAVQLERHLSLSTFRKRRKLR